MAPLAARVPSIAGRVTRTLALWALAWGLVLGVAAWLAVKQELDELLDDTLQATAEVLMGTVAQAREAAPSPAALPAPAAPRAEPPSGRFAWQLVQHQGSQARVLVASSTAPAQPLHPVATSGLADVPGWRVYGAPTAVPGRWLYVAQTREERHETAQELAELLALATLPMALLAVLWLRLRLRHELQPLQALSQRLARLDAAAPAAALGQAPRQELQPVYEALDALSQRLARRLAQERAFAAHAAHALRTPLAGIDAQLAVALREADPALQPRLLRVRGAAARLQRVVAALLALFRSGVDLRRDAVDLSALMARVAVPGLDVKVVQGRHAALHADADLLSAALLNLLDNAVRHGARQVQLGVPAPQCLRVADDGPGVPAERRATLREALARRDDGVADGTGLGLRLVVLVAQAHGGQVQLPEPEPDEGFVVELTLGAPA